MENYYSSYPESGDSSPRSREIDFDNPPPWEEHQQPPSNYRVKIMCSYGGKIHPRPHDNQLSYISGETKILAVDRSIKFAPFISKLSALCSGGDSDVSFKYQLPGEDLDALISVTNDDDLEHMMTEYDRLYRASPKPARLRLFLFSGNSSGSFGSRDGKSDRERFVDALNSAPGVDAAAAAPAAPAGPQSNVDFLFGLEKGNPHHPHTPPAKSRDPAGESASPEPDVRVRAGDDRVSSPDPPMIPVDIQRHILDLQRLQLQQQDQGMYRRRNDENLVGVQAGDYYIQKPPEKAPPPAAPPATLSAPAAYWPEKHIGGGGGGGGGGFQATGGGEPPVYMIPAPAGVYHPPIGRPVAGPAATQGYFQVQRMGSDVYREQQHQQQQQQQQPPPAYSLFTAAQPVAAAAPRQPANPAPNYSEGISMMRAVGVGGSGGVGMGAADVGYAQVAYDSAGRQVYDSAGRQVYYTAPAGSVVPAPYAAAMAAAAGDMRVGPNGALSQHDGKNVAKVSQTSM